jgi:hypothetical protein
MSPVFTPDRDTSLTLVTIRAELSHHDSTDDHDSI